MITFKAGSDGFPHPQPEEEQPQSIPQQSLVSRLTGGLVNQAMTLAMRISGVRVTHEEQQTARAEHPIFRHVRSFLPADSWFRASNYLPSRLRPEPGIARDTFDMAVPGAISAILVHPFAAAGVLTVTAADALIGDEIEQSEAKQEEEQRQAQLHQEQIRITLEQRRVLQERRAQEQRAMQLPARPTMTAEQR